MEGQRSQEINREPDWFINWSLYISERINKSLKDLGISYIPPGPNEELRRKIISHLDNCQTNHEEQLVLSVCLRFLESGLMIDGWNNDEEGRHKLLLSNQLKLEDGRIVTLYELAKEVNKLTGNRISQIIIAAQMIEDEKVRKRGQALMEKVRKIKKERGYFKIEDLYEVDELASLIIETIISSKQ